jgi:hypothetical protein
VPDTLARIGAGARPDRTRGLAGDTGAMGMNPFRPHRSSPADYLMVAAAAVVVIALVTWAFLG